MTSEKRKHIRFIPKTETYAALGTRFSKVGKLKDISSDGLAFKYIKKIEGCVQDSSTVAIFASKNSFILSNLACKLIYDSPLDLMNNSQHLTTKFSMNRCGVQFAAINDYQLEKLKSFIEHYTRRL